MRNYIRNKVLVFLMLFVSISASAQQTAIPDSNFEQALIDYGYDSGTPDGFVLTETIETVTTLHLTDNNITDITGIEDFIALTNLTLSSNNLDSISLPQNTALTVLSCANCQLTNLDVTSNINLERLVVANNQLTSLDLSQNPALVYLNAFDS